MARSDLPVFVRDAALEAVSEGVLQRAHRLAGRLAGLYGAYAVAALLLLVCVWWPWPPPRLPALAQEAAAGGLGAMVLPAVLLVLTGTVATLLLTAARRRPTMAAWLRSTPEASGSSEAEEPRGVASPGFAARVGCGVAVPAGAGLCLLASLVLWPGKTAPAAGTADLLGALVFAMAFVSLVAERVLRAVPSIQLPEAPGLRRLLLLATVLLAVAGAAEMGRGAGLGWVRYVAMATSVLPVLVAGELALRAAARLFLPQPRAQAAAAGVDSILAAVLTGGPRAPGTLLRTHLGVDFARSWALQFLARAALPALVLTGLLCWGLSGLKLIDLDQRGVYERLGAPVAVLGPGLHLLLPWPLGRLRPVEFGTIHTIAVGSAAPPEMGAGIGAEAVPPPSADRLWETAHDTEVNYLVASNGLGLQSFQLVSTEILVLYRVGLSDAAARAFVYGAADGDGLVRQASARLATRFFGQRTLDQVMNGQPASLAETLRAALAADIARAHAGIEVLAVVIEEIHPPAGAAGAYHRVQAAQIDASASISDETGRATRMLGKAGEEARQRTDAATAGAAETVAVAAAASYRFHADLAAYRAAPAPFLLERSLADIGAALAASHLTLMDYRLGQQGGPLIDLRALQQGDGAAETASPAPAPGKTADTGEQPGTFSYVTPGGSTDTTAQTPDVAQDAAP